EIIGTARAIATARKLDVLHGVERRPAVGAGGNRMFELAVAVYVDGGVVDRERRTAHVAKRRRQVRAVGLRDLAARANRENVPAIDAARTGPQIGVLIGEDRVRIPVRLVLRRAARF